MERRPFLRRSIVYPLTELVQLWPNFVNAVYSMIAFVRLIMYHLDRRTGICLSFTSAAVWIASRHKGSCAARSTVLMRYSFTGYAYMLANSTRLRKNPYDFTLCFLICSNDLDDMKSLPNKIFPRIGLHQKALRSHDLPDDASSGR